MKLTFFKDLENRKHFKTNEILVRLVKMLISNKNLKTLSYFELNSFYLHKVHLMRKASRSKICNRCVETNKVGAVYRYFKLENETIQKIFIYFIKSRDYMHCPINAI